mgnify:CR=1 FL=1
MPKTYFLVLSLIIALFFFGCGESKDNGTTNEPDPSSPVQRWEAITQIFHEGLGAMVETDKASEKNRYRFRFADTAKDSKIIFEEPVSNLDTIDIRIIKWGEKKYADVMLSYGAIGEHSYGKGLGGWKRKFLWVELFDGQTGESYFKAEPYSYSFEEHNITGDTSHPLAATSCFFLYKIDWNFDANLMTISDLLGSCLPDLEEGRYNFKNNRLVLTKE